MNVYMVNVYADIPYPWPKSYLQEAATEGAAVARALRAYRKDVRNRDGRAKRIAEFSLKVRKTKIPSAAGERMEKEVVK